MHEKPEHPDDATLNELVEGTLDAAAQQEVEQHLAECARCRTLAEDLREIQRVAASLDLRQPPARAWSRIERAIKFEGEGARRLEPSGSDDARLEASRSITSRSTMIGLAAAAMLAVATLVGLRFAVADHPAQRAETADSAAPADAAVSTDASAAIEAELRAAESHYDKAIKGLEQIATNEQSALDPKTAATLQKNLAVIDQAISESRAAVRAQPTSEPARESLMDSFKTKLALLQDTVALINEMRKGNEAGAARAVSGLKQKG
jgi:anti-sigma factor ChrR (cupin superfamily)